MLAHPGPPAIEEDQARERGEAPQERRRDRPRPDVLDVQEVADEDEVQRPVPDGLIRDVHAVGGLRVPSFGYVHARHPSADEAQPQPSTRRETGTKSNLVAPL